MKLNRFLPVLLALISLVFISARCDDEDYIKVSSTNLSLTREQGSSTDLTISANVQWMASINYDGSQTGWLNISTTMGNECDNLPVTITSTSANHDNADRVAHIQIIGGDAAVSVTVTQKGYNADTNLDISITDVVALTTSVAFKHTFGRKVSYYYSGYLNSAAAGWTDEKIAKELESNFEAGKPDDDIISCDGLRANTSYILCAVGFDELGNQGRVMKEPVKTAAVVSKRPDVSIENVHLESDNGNIYWAWETVVGAYCAKYYMIAHSGDNAYVLGNSCDALVAWLIKDAINSGDIDPILKNSPWYMKRGNNENYFYCAAWAVGDDNKFSGELDTAFGHLSSNSKTRAVITNSTTKKYSAKHEELKKSIKVYSSTLY